MNKKHFFILFMALLFVGAEAQKVQWTSSTEQEKWIQQKGLNFQSSKPAGQVDITINPTEKLQQIDGFGGCFNEIGWEALLSITPAEREKILKELFTPAGANFSICRMPVAANDYSLSYYSYNDVPEDFTMGNFNIDRDRYILIPYIKEALKIRPDLKLWASPWSPPAWMKVNNHYALHGGKINGQSNGVTPEKEILNNSTAFRMEASYLKAYALYLSKFIQAYRKEGINLSALCVQNEIVYSPHWSSCTWRAEDLSYFIRSALGPQFKKDSLATQIWLGTVNGPDPNYMRTVLNDKETSKYISGVGVQWDAKHAIPVITKEYPQYRYMQTESECGNGEKNWKSAEYTWSLINHYLNSGVNSYMYWNMVLDPSGKSTWDWVQNMLISVDKNTKAVVYYPEYYIMKHLSHFVLPGAYRLKTSGGKDHLAFINPDGTTVLVLVNTGDADKRFNVSVADKTLDVNVKAKSFNTLCWK
ncbi:MAG TPA: glycoside hydrolase family 30 beta sandwich domain-containing protein [Paludibacter sp.]|nr:glycoside hydrolase family 30 beta sandwich domain-containing protein [Paludibacter sp.]